VVLLLVLLLIPDGGNRIQLLFKFLAAGAIYLGAMLISYIPAWLVHGKWQDRPKPVIAAVTYFMQVLMGG
jgi:hypothetical protein